MADEDYRFDPRAGFSDIDSYFVKLVKRWKLDELGDFSKNYEQSFYAALALEAVKAKSNLHLDTQSRLLSQMARYPWKGGYSTVHFYVGVKRIVGRKRQPEIQKIQYASPGFIELSAMVEIAKNLGLIVGSLSGCVAAVNVTYNNIYKGLRQRQLNEITVEKARLELAKDQRDFLLQSIDEIGQPLNLDDRARLVEAAGNEIRALKILLSMYRRIRIVSKYQEEGKIYLPKNSKENR